MIFQNEEELCRPCIPVVGSLVYCFKPWERNPVAASFLGDGIPASCRGVDNEHRRTEIGTVEVLIPIGIIEDAYFLRGHVLLAWGRDALK